MQRLRAEGPWQAYINYCSVENKDVKCPRVYLHYRSMMMMRMMMLV